jgi:hypothetical protein
MGGRINKRLGLMVAIPAAKHAGKGGFSKASGSVSQNPLAHQIITLIIIYNG